MENVITLKKKAEQIRQMMVDLLRSKRSFLGNIDDWGLEGLLVLAMDPAVGNLTLDEAYRLLRKYLSRDVFQPELCGIGKRLNILYDLCNSIYQRTTQESVIAPTDEMFEQVQQCLSAKRQRILILVNVERELFFQAWYESPNMEPKEMVFWDHGRLFILKAVKNLDEMPNGLDRKCYQQALNEVEAGATTFPLMIILNGFPVSFAEELREAE